MYQCFCCGVDFGENSDPPKYCGECGSLIDENRRDVDKSEAIEHYANLLAEHFFDSDNLYDDSVSIRYRVKLKISWECHQSIIDRFESQKRILRSIGDFTVEFDQNVSEAYAGHDTYLRFRFANNSNNLLRIKLFWDDPETDDDQDLSLESKSFIKPRSSLVIGGTHIFRRIGLKEISDLHLTVSDAFHHAKFRLSPIVFKVKAPNQNITQHFITENKISIEGRGVVDATGMGGHSRGGEEHAYDDPKWIFLEKTFIPENDRNQASLKVSVIQTDLLPKDIIESDPSDDTATESFDISDLESVRSAASKNNLEAIKVLGWFYLYGKGVVEDDAQAFELFMLAASQGHAGSQFFLGFMYENGFFVPENHLKAVEWYSKSAAQKNLTGIRSLGECYLNGLGVSQNELKAKELFEEAASLGDLRSIALIGDLYANGLAVIKDPRIAVENYMKAATAGDEYAALRLGEFYYRGEGGVIDLDLAIKWLSAAANQGDELAQYYLSEIYITSSDHKNESLSAEFALKSAEGGCVHGMTMLGRHYRLGTGVPLNLELAKHWLQQARDGGDEIAVADLDHFSNDSYWDCLTNGGAVSKNDPDVVEDLSSSGTLEQNKIDCDCPAIDEALGALESTFEILDTAAYGEDELANKNYQSVDSISVELESVITSVVVQSTGWPHEQLYGVLFENVYEIAVDNQGLIINFNGFASVIYKSGVATIAVENNELTFQGSFEWHQINPVQFGFWINGETINLGDYNQNQYSWGGSWDLEYSIDQPLRDTINNANRWVSRICAVAKGELNGHELLFPSNESEGTDDLETTGDGPTWNGDFDSNGMATGYGTFIWPNGDRYDGCCLNGLLNGEGTYLWASGERYDGSFYLGKRHGFGVNVLPNGIEQKGNWADDKFLGSVNTPRNIFSRIFK